MAKAARRLLAADMQAVELALEAFPKFQSSTVLEEVAEQTSPVILCLIGVIGLLLILFGALVLWTAHS